MLRIMLPLRLPRAPVGRPQTITLVLARSELPLTHRRHRHRSPPHAAAQVACGPRAGSWCSGRRCAGQPPRHALRPDRRCRRGGRSAPSSWALLAPVRYHHHPPPHQLLLLRRRRRTAARPHRAARAPTQCSAATAARAADGGRRDGAGKGTIAADIVRDFGMTHLSSGDLLRSQVTLCLQAMLLGGTGIGYLSYRCLQSVAVAIIVRRAFFTRRPGGGRGCQDAPRLAQRPRCGTHHRRSAPPRCRSGTGSYARADCAARPVHEQALRRAAPRCAEAAACSDRVPPRRWRVERHLAKQRRSSSRFPRACACDALDPHQRRPVAVAPRCRQAGDLVPDTMITQLVLDEVDRKYAANDLLLDGFPRTVTQASALRPACAAAPFMLRPSAAGCR